jgi:hypothetical protein
MHRKVPEKSHFYGFFGLIIGKYWRIGVGDHKFGTQAEACKSSLIDVSKSVIK